jgi:hypothetical protein
MLWSDIVEKTHDECKQDILTFLSGEGFTGAFAWNQGSIPLLFVDSLARVWSKLTEIAVALKNAHTLADCEDEATDAYCDSQYNEPRVLASAATYLKELTCEAGEGPHSIDIGDVVLTDGNYTYRNIAGNGITYPYNLAGGASVTLLFQADQPGADPTVTASTIDTLQTTFNGVTVTGGSLQSEGVDRESDASYKARCRTKWPTLSEGETISDHVVNICLNADTTIKRATVDDENPRGDYTANVYLAGESGIVGSGAVAAAQSALDRRFFRSVANPTVLAIASAADPLSISGTIYYYSNYTLAVAQTAVEASLAEFFSSIPNGGFMYGTGLNHVVTLDDVRNAVRSATSGGQRVVKTFVMTLPAADHEVEDFDVVTLGSIAGLNYIAAADD